MGTRGGPQGGMGLRGEEGGPQVVGGSQVDPGGGLVGLKGWSLGLAPVKGGEGQRVGPRGVGP